MDDKYLGQTGKCAKCGEAVCISEDSLPREEKAASDSPPWPARKIGLAVGLSILALFLLGISLTFSGIGPHVEGAGRGNAKYNEAEREEAEADFRLAVKYMVGDGVERDPGEAVRWYKAAAELGHLGAQNNLGIMYETGDGIKENTEEAFKWYKAAAEQGHAEAQSKVSAMSAAREKAYRIAHPVIAFTDEHASAARKALLDKGFPNPTSILFEGEIGIVFAEIQMTTDELSKRDTMPERAARDAILIIRNAIYPMSGSSPDWGYILTLTGESPGPDLKSIWGECFFSGETGIIWGEGRSLEEKLDKKINGITEGVYIIKPYTP